MGAEADRKVPISKRSRAATAALLMGTAALAWVAAVSIAIERQAGRDEARPAGAIVIFGAAEYAGRPSPVLRARLDHAFDLYQRKLAGLVIVTGGAGGDPVYSEGAVGRDYLRKRGVPDRALIAETLGSDTAHSAERVANILRANGVETCDAVSDAYHMFRVKRMMAREGITAYAAPRPESMPKSLWTRTLTVLREAVSFTAWEMHLT